MDRRTQRMGYLREMLEKLQETVDGEDALGVHEADVNNNRTYMSTLRAELELHQELEWLWNNAIKTVPPLGSVPGRLVARLERMIAKLQGAPDASE